jgi:hypothetical protein
MSTVPFIIVCWLCLSIGGAIGFVSADWFAAAKQADADDELVCRLMPGVVSFRRPPSSTKRKELICRRVAFPL